MIKWTLTFLAFLLVAAFIVAPGALMLGSSVWGDGGLTLEHFRAAYGKAYQADLLWNTIWISLLTTVFCGAVSLPMAVILGRSDVPFRRGLSALAMLPFVLPPYLIALNWVFLIGSNAFARRILEVIFGKGDRATPLEGIAGVSFLMALCYFPMVFLLTQSALQWVSAEAEEAGRFSLSRWGVFRRITMRLALPSFAMAMLFVTVIAMSCFDVPAFLSVNVYSIQILSEFTSSYQPRQAAALAVPLVAVSMALVLVIRSYLSRKAYGAETEANEKPLFIFGRWNRLVSLFPILVVGLTAILPFYTFATVAEEWSSMDAMARNMGQSFMIGVQTSAVAGLIMSAAGLVVAYWSLRARSGWVRWGIDLSYLTALALPPTLVGIGLIQLYNWPGRMQLYFYNTYWMIVVASFARFLPFAVLILRSAMRKVSMSGDEAADCCGLTWWQKFWNIYVLRLRVPLFNAFVVTGLFALGELPTTQLVAPAGGTTLPIRVFTILHYGQDKLLAAMALAMMAVAGLVFLFYFLVTNRKLELI